MEFLTEFLGGGARPIADIEEAAEASLITKATLRRAKEALGIVPRREGGFGDEGYWVWELPS